MNHTELCEAAMEAIRAVFSDQSVSQSETKRSLKQLQDEIDVMLETLSYQE